MPKSASPVSSAKSILETLAERRRVAALRADEVAKTRKAIAFGAHTGSETARRQLDDFNQQLVMARAEIESLDEAVAEAVARVVKAERHEAQAAERAHAAAVLRDAAEAEKLARAADEAGRQFRASLIALDETLDRLGRSGFRGVVGAGMRIAIAKATHSLLVGLRHVGLEVSPIRPSERRSYAETTATAIASARGAAQRVLDDAADEKADGVAA
jgi:hypothetical protein